MISWTAVLWSIILWTIFISYCRTFRWANHNAWLDFSLSIHWQNVRTYPIMVKGYAAIVTLFWYCLCRTFPLLCLPWHGLPQSHIVQPCLAMFSRVPWRPTVSNSGARLLPFLKVSLSRNFPNNLDHRLFSIQQCLSIRQCLALSILCPAVPVSVQPYPNCVH